ncbi:barstar family protein [Streptomyces sp. NPDC057101]|uniref:barstar family protein n=1 Tax=Streptomyces sp. NPDC057101 TaxID=3346020 RepID=UPI0036385E8D
MTDSELIVDLRGRLIETLNDFWDAVSEPCGLPEWLARNLDAWSDTIETRGISEVIDSHDVLIVHFDQRGLFDGHRQEADVLAGIFDGEQNQLIVHGRSRRIFGRLAQRRLQMRMAASWSAAW